MTSLFNVQHSSGCLKRASYLQSRVHQNRIRRTDKAWFSSNCRVDKCCECFVYNAQPGRSHLEER